MRYLHMYAHVVLSGRRSAVAGGSENCEWCGAARTGNDRACTQPTRGSGAGRCTRNNHEDCCGQEVSHGARVKLRRCCKVDDAVDTAQHSTTACITARHNIPQTSARMRAAAKWLLVWA